MHIEGLSSVDFRDEKLVVDGYHIPYGSIESLRFTATVTQHSVNGIPSGKSYEVDFALRCNGAWTPIKPDRRMLGGMRKSTFEGMQKAYGILAHITFTQRVERYEQEMERVSFFSIGRHQIDREGHVFESGRQVASLRDTEARRTLEPFALNIIFPKPSFRERLRGKTSPRDIVIPLNVDKDCAIYMLDHFLGLRWKGNPPPEKQVDRQKLFYETAIRFGALMSCADGSSDPSELMELKRFFHLSEANIPNAAGLFNETLARKPSPESILKPFASEFSDAVEAKEGFLLGMVAIALADNFLHDAEIALIQKASAILGIQRIALERVVRSAGIDPSLFFPEDKKAHDKSRRGATSNAHLRTLGLQDGASAEEIQAAHRELVRRYHPDVLRGQGIPDQEVARCEAILAQINAAYDALRAPA